MPCYVHYFFEGYSVPTICCASVVEIGKIRLLLLELGRLLCLADLVFIPLICIADKS